MVELFYSFVNSKLLQASMKLIILRNSTNMPKRGKASSYHVQKRRNHENNDGRCGEEEGTNSDSSSVELLQKCE